jgi:hypothetical protein
MNNQYGMEETDLDFNIEEVEPVVAPDVDGEPGPVDSITTSIVSVCRCS